MFLIDYHGGIIVLNSHRRARTINSYKFHTAIVRRRSCYSNFINNRIMKSHLYLKSDTHHIVSCTSALTIVQSCMQCGIIAWVALTCQPKISMRLKIPLTIEPPYPICLTDEVITGFSRGSSELGIPTANINMSSALESLNTGIYFGFCKVSPKYEKKPGYFSSQTNQKVYFNFGQSLRSEDIEGLPMVMSIGWNPFFNNEKKAAEVHIIHHFPDTFYGASIKIAILGYLRPERDYTTKGT